MSDGNVCPRCKGPRDHGDECQTELARKTVVSVHVLLRGQPLCGFSEKLPMDWPAGHRWVRSLDELPRFWAPLACAGCRAAEAA